MDSHAGHTPALRVPLSINAAAFIAAGVLMIAVARTGSLSPLRLTPIVGAFLIGAALLALVVLLHFRPQLELKFLRACFSEPLAARLRLLLAAVFAIAWCLTWLLPQDAGSLRDYFIGVYPLILCGLLFSGTGLVLLLFGVDGAAGTRWNSYWHEHRAALIALVASLAGFLVIALLTRWLGVLHSNEPFWRGASVPILASQVTFVLIIAIAALKLEALPAARTARLDWILFILIWVVAGVLWAAGPVSAGSWTTSPRAPNFEYYPFSDSLVYDLGSQFALIGQGINNHVFFDRAFYMSFLVYLHSLLGQDYQQLMAGQAALFAIFPALLYLIGKQLHSRNAGIILAGLTILRGLNSLTATPWIHSATFKNMLTDFPGAIGVALLVLLVLRWLEAPQERRHILVWIGGVLGLTSLLRPHVLLLLPLLVGLVLWAERPRWRTRMIVSGLAVLAALVGVFPWIASSSSAASPIAFYGQRIRDVLVQRYPGFAPVPPATPRPPRGTAVPSLETPTAVAVTPPPGAPPASALLPSSGQAAPFQVTHFLHNLVLSGLVFPDSPQFQSVVTTVRDGEAFWQLRWDGSTSATALVMLLINLGLIAFGLGAAYQRLRWRGLIPLAVFLIYLLADALARTSGGRYLVPVDWILVAYFALGLAEGIQLLGQLAGRAAPLANAPNQAMPAASERRGPNGDRLTRRVGYTFVFVALIGGLLPLAGNLHPRRFPPADAASLLNELDPYWQSLNIARPEVEAFLGRSGAVLLNGRALYPRYYRRGAGELFSFPPFLPAPYTRTVLVLIGPGGAAFTELPGGVPTEFADASDAIVLGCQSTSALAGYELVNAIAIVLPAQGASYARNPSAPLSCPLRVPVCNSNGVCR